MNEENKQLEQEQESSIDFGKIFRDLLKHKRLYFIVLPCAFVLAAIYTLSLPNYYNCKVQLSPELSRSRSSSSLASLASSFGISLGTSGSAMGNEALFPTLYPDLMNSVDFKTSLFPVKVRRDKDGQEFTYYDYLCKEQKAPWWTTAKAAVFGLFASKKPEVKEKKVDPFRLTRKQTAIVKAINSRVVCDVDKKTMVITISVTDQDPLICATMADSVKQRLQRFITDYRTSKARVDVKHYQKLYKEAKARYDRSRHLYADFADANQDLILQSVRQRQTELENEMQLQYNIYQQVAAQLQQAEMKVQEETPAFTTLQSATVPIRKAGPKRARMCLIFLFLAFLGTTAYVLYKEDDLKPLLGLS